MLIFQGVFELAFCLLLAFRTVPVSKSVGQMRKRMRDFLRLRPRDWIQLFRQVVFTSSPKMRVFRTLYFFSHDVFGHCFFYYGPTWTLKKENIYIHFSVGRFSDFTVQPFSSGGKILSIKGRTNFSPQKKT